MALKDCIEKMAGKVNREDIAMLEQFIDEGLSDAQAVQKLLILSDKDIIDITARARSQGAQVKNSPKLLAEIVGIENKQIKQIQSERQLLDKAGLDLAADYGDMQFAIDTVKHHNGKIDIYDDKQLMDRLSSMFFRNPDLFRQGGIPLLRGNTPLEVFAAFKELDAQQRELRNELRENEAKLQALNDRQEALTGDRRKDTKTLYQQSDLGFTSGLATAIRVMPFGKVTDADQFMAWLKKQPGVAVAQRPAQVAEGEIDFESFLPEADWLDLEDFIRVKGSVTKDEMVQFVEENGIQLEETVLGRMAYEADARIIYDEVTSWEGGNYERAVEITGNDNAADLQAWIAFEQNSLDTYFVVMDNDSGNVYVRREDDDQFLVVGGNINDQNFHDADWAITQDYQSRHRSPTPFDGEATAEQWSLGGTEAGTNYREVLLRIPELPKDPDTRVGGQIVAGPDSLTPERDIREFLREIDLSSYLNLNSITRQDEAGNIVLEFKELKNSDRGAIAAIASANNLSMIEDRDSAPGAPGPELWDQRVNESYRQLSKDEREQLTESLIAKNHIEKADGFYGYQILRETGKLAPEMIAEAGLQDTSLYSDLVSLRNAEKGSLQPGLRRNFRGGHFEYNNILGWFRTKDHIGENGEKVLLIEETQSDWHQQGRQTGYEGRRGLEARREQKYAVERARQDFRAADRDLDPLVFRLVDALYADQLADAGTREGEQFPLQQAYIAKFKSDIYANQTQWVGEYANTAQLSGIEVDSLLTPELLDSVEAAQDLKGVQDTLAHEYNRIRLKGHAVPDAPFKDNAWVSLVSKRILRMAVEEGYHQVAWTTGKQQVDRYSLRVKEKVTKLEYDPVGETVIPYGLEGEQLQPMEGIPRDKLQSTIGKEMTQSIESQITEIEGRYEVASAADVDLNRNDPIMVPFNMESDEITDEAISSWLVAVDVNGELLRNNHGAIVADPSEAGIKEHIERFTWDAVDLPSVSGDELVVGGVAMENFYDNTLGRVLQKAARKLDKKAQMRKEGQSVALAEGAPHTLQMEMISSMPRTPNGPTRIPVWKILDRDGTAVKGPFTTKEEAQGRLDQYFNRAKVHVMDLTDNVKHNALNGQTLFQRKRGSITFDETRKAFIRLGDSANFDTLIHEAGHMYLELMRTLAERPDAPKDLQDMWGTILEHLGVEQGREITTEHHETFADSFLTYVSEGKAPSVGLRDAFGAFRDWLKMIWQRITNQPDITLSPEVRQVFDRILASDQEISMAEQATEYASLFLDRDQIKMSPEAFAVYQKQVVRAHNEGVEKQTVKAMKELKKSEQAWWDTEKAKIRELVEAEAHDMPVFVAQAMLQRGENPDGSQPDMAAFKLNGDQLKKEFGQGFVNRLPRPFVYSRVGGVDPDVAAQLFGFKDAAALVEGLIKAPRMKDWIDAETESRMREQFPDRQLDGSLRDEAIETVHNDRRADVLATEMRALRKLVQQDRPIVRATEQAQKRQRKEEISIGKSMLPKRVEMKMFRLAAAEQIEGKKVRDVQPHKYLAAERKNAKAAFDAWTAGNIEKAYHFKLKQIRNFELYRAAVKARKSIDSAQKYLTKFENPRTQMRLGKGGVLDPILGILDAIDFRKVSLAEVDRIKAAQALRDQIESGEIVATPEIAERLEAGTNWQELTVSEILAMKEVIQQIEHMADKQQYAYVNGEKILLEDAIGDVSEAMMTTNKVIDTGTSERTKGAALKQSLRQGVSAWLRPSSIARILDKAGFGAITRRVIVPMRRAYSERLIPMMHKYQEDVAQIYQKHYTAAELGQFSKKQYDIKLHNDKYSKSDLLSMALNWGNEGNRHAVLGGRKRNGQPAYNDEGVKHMLSHLTEKDWAFVQDVWDYFDSYWDELSAAEKRRRGIAPARVEASPFAIRTADGRQLTVKGGYMPLVYDRRHSDRVKVDELEDYMKQMGNGVYVSSSTRAGATYERVQNHGRVVKLGLNVIDTKLRELIRDLAVGDEVNYLARVLNNSEVRNSFHETGNEVALETLNLWLTDAAVGELPSEGFVEHSAAWIRTGFTKSKLAWNALTTILQFTGVAQTAAVIGTVNYAHGMAKYLQNPKAMTRHVMETSPFLKARYEVGAWNKDVQDTKAHLESFFGAAPTRAKQVMNTAAHTYFWPIMQAQKVVDVSTWLGAYHKGRNELELNDSDAHIYADTQVEAAQTSGFFSDRSGLERGTLGSRKNRQSQFIRIWTTLISYMLAKGNIAYEKGKATNFRKPTEVAKYAADLVLLWTVEGIMSAIIYNQWPDDSDEPEDWAKWAVAKTGESMFAGIPFVREVPGSKFGGGNTPIGSFAHDLWDFQVQVGQGETDAALRKATINVLGTAGHLPASQTNRMLDTIWSEDDPEVYEYIFGERD